MHDDIKLISNIDPHIPSNDKNFFIIEKTYTYTPESIIPYSVHRHPFYELTFFIEGEGSFMIDFKEYPIHKGSIFFFSPSQIHYPSAITGNVHSFLLRFDRSLFAEKTFFDNLSIFDFDALVVTGAEYTILETLVYKIAGEFQENKPLNNACVENFLNIFLIHIQRLLPQMNDQPRKTNIFASLNQLIKENGYKIATSSYYAKQLKIPLKLLNQTVKAYSGMPCGNYIRSKTLIEAKRLLLYTTLNVSEIANALGFIDMKYFSRFFKQHTGLPPVRFKKVIISKYNTE